MKRKITPGQALAEHLGIDYSELKDYRYHAGKSSTPIYAIDDCYYCAGKKAAIHMDIEFDWIEVPDKYINSFGIKIFKTQ